jgi:Na+/H+ antiporter
MDEMLLLCIGLVLSVSLLVVFANKLRIAYPIFLVLAGLALGFIPAIPNITIDPHLVFLVILPPILFDAAYNSSWRALWRWRRIILVMAIGFVLITATAVAFIACWLIPGFTLAEGFLLVAIISPPDASAATAVLRYVKLPKGMVSILEGESLLNDATSLTLFSFALEAITTSNFVLHQAVFSFFLVVLSGIAIGLVFGVVFYAIYRWVPTTANLDIALSMVFPYLIYLAAEDLHSSGVLAVVTGGLFIAYQNHYIFGHSSRLRSQAVWRSVVFILNTVIFFLIGLQLPEISAGLSSLTLGHALYIALIIALVVILVRVFSAYFSAIFTRFISRFITVAQSRPGWRNPTVIGWAGLRGVVSLASALAIPLLLHGKPFPYRDLVLFITLVVIIVTLVGQGLILPTVVHIVKPEYFPDQKPDELQMLEMDTHLVNASITELESKYKRDLENNPMLRNRYEQLRLKKSLYEEAITKEKKRTLGAILTRFKRVMVAITEHQRTELHRFRHKDHYDDDVIAAIERRLDLEEERLEEDSE